MRDVLIRATSAEVWRAAAIAHRLLIAEGAGYRPARGIDMVEIGPAVLSPGLYDAGTGEEIVAPVIDQRHHVNLRVSGPALTDIDPDTGLPVWQALELVWIGYGSLAPANAAEVAYLLGGVEIVTQVQTPRVVWAD
jgi:hypothetical protein